MKIVSFILLCFMSTPALADTEIEMDAFSSKSIFTEPLAHPRTPGDIGMSINSTRYKGQKIYYFEGVIGRSLPLVTATIGELKLQLSAQASAWIALGYDDWSFPLITEDFFLAAPISFRYKNWSGSIAYNHISAHQGDGMDMLMEETLSEEEQKEFEFYEDLAEDEGMGLTVVDPEAYSRDFISMYVSYERKLGILNSRLYGHLGYVHKMIPEELGRWFVGNGLELRYPHDMWSPYYSQDVTWNEDTDSVDYSGQLGVYIANEEEDIFSFRLAIIAFMGYDRKGQFIGRKDKRIGFGFFVR